MRIEKQNPGFAKRVKSWLTGKYVENGSTASQNIPAGKWVTWKGQVCISKTAITAGDTLSSTNLGTEEEGMLNTNDCFSPGEQVVGRWHDGKRLYRYTNTFNINTPPTGTFVTLGTIAKNLNIVITYGSYWLTNDSSPITFNIANARYQPSTGNILFSQSMTSSSYNWRINVVLYYTKD